MGGDERGGKGGGKEKGGEGIRREGRGGEGNGLQTVLSPHTTAAPVGTPQRQPPDPRHISVRNHSSS